MMTEKKAEKKIAKILGEVWNEKFLHALGKYQDTFPNGGENDVLIKLLEEEQKEFENFKTKIAAFRP